ncbi:MAG: ImmA/IrrE family metallo-endopeptidase [Bryobacteraceae bacterium]|nr:ImmA/IrrE family metallo-endopeptidase [Bryobacteraceae bacterium]
MKSRRDAILEGAKAAAKIHRQFDLRRHIESQASNIDVFGTIVKEKIPLLFRPLEGLLGAFLPGPVPGIIVTTRRQLSVQRFTGAHELGHAAMGHQASLDDESMLKRSESPGWDYDPFEVAANAFATHFLLPKWLLISHAARHRWTRRDLSTPSVVYQLALRAGTSYQATSLALFRHKLIDSETFDSLTQTEVKRLKQNLLDGHQLENWYPDVWVLTEADEGSIIEGDSRDAFVLRLRESSGAGYLWKIDDLKNAGFLLFRDDRVIPPAEDEVGGDVERVVGARPGDSRVGHISLQQTRPWQTSGVPLSQLSFSFDLRGKESGRPRAERRLVAA